MRKEVLLMVGLMMAFSVTLNAEDSNATSKVDTNVTEKVAEDINDGWWDDSDLDISDVLAVQAENKKVNAENKKVNAENKKVNAEYDKLNKAIAWM